MAAGSAGNFAPHLTTRRHSQQTVYRNNLWLNLALSAVSARTRNRKLSDLQRRTSSLFPGENLIICVALGKIRFRVKWRNNVKWVGRHSCRCVFYLTGSPVRISMGHYWNATDRTWGIAGMLLTAWGIAEMLLTRHRALLECYWQGMGHCWNTTDRAWDIARMPLTGHGTLLECYRQGMGHCLNATDRAWGIARMLLTWHGALLECYWQGIGHCWNATDRAWGIAGMLLTEHRALLECYWQGMGHCWKATDRANPKYSLSKCYFFDHKYHIDWPGIEPGAWNQTIMYLFIRGLTQSLQANSLKLYHDEWAG